MTIVGVAVGGTVVGDLAVGGAIVGGLAMGGTAVGGLAMGGAAVGRLTVGGAAVCTVIHAKTSNIGLVSKSIFFIFSPLLFRC